MEKALLLKKDIDTLFEEWNEYSQFELKGVGNLSVSDLEELEMYADSYIASGGTSFPGLMSPIGEIKEILDSYGIKSAFNGFMM